MHLVYYVSSSRTRCYKVRKKRVSMYDVWCVKIPVNTVLLYVLHVWCVQCDTLQCYFSYRNVQYAMPWYTLYHTNSWVETKIALPILLETELRHKPKNACDRFCRIHGLYNRHVQISFPTKPVVLNLFLPRLPEILVLCFKPPGYE